MPKYTARLLERGAEFWLIEGGDNPYFCTGRDEPGLCLKNTPNEVLRVLLRRAARQGQVHSVEHIDLVRVDETPGETRREIVELKGIVNFDELDGFIISSHRGWALIAAATSTSEAEAEIFQDIKSALTALQGATSRGTRESNTTWWSSNAVLKGVKLHTTPTQRTFTVLS